MFACQSSVCKTSMPMSSQEALASASIKSSATSVSGDDGKPKRWKRKCSPQLAWLENGVSLFKYFYPSPHWLPFVEYRIGVICNFQWNTPNMKAEFSLEIWKVISRPVCQSIWLYKSSINSVVTDSHKTIKWSSQWMGVVRRRDEEGGWHSDRIFISPLPSS